MKLTLKYAYCWEILLLLGLTISLRPLEVVSVCLVQSRGTLLPVSGTGSPMSSAVGKLSQKEDMIPRAMQIVINTSAHSVRKFGIKPWILVICPEAPCYLQQSHPPIEKCKAVWIAQIFFNSIQKPPQSKLFYCEQLVSRHPTMHTCTHAHM